MRNTATRPASCNVVARPHPVRPRRVVVTSGSGVVAREQSVQVFGVAKVLVHQGRRVGERQHVLAKPLLVAEHVVDQRAEEHDVRADPNRNVLVGTVLSLSSNGPQDLLVVGEREFLIPFVEAFILEIDFPNRKIFMDLPEGLLDVE